MMAALECSPSSGCRAGMQDETITIPLSLASEVASLLFGLALSERTQGLPAVDDALRLHADLRKRIEARVVEIEGAE